MIKSRRLRKHLCCHTLSISYKSANLRELNKHAESNHLCNSVWKITLPLAPLTCPLAIGQKKNLMKKYHWRSWQWWATMTHGLEWPKSQRLATPNAGEDSAHRKLSHLPPVGRQDGAARGVFKIQTHSSALIQEWHFSAFTTKGWKLLSTAKPAHEHVQQHYLYVQKRGCNQGVLH